MRGWRWRAFATVGACLEGAVADGRARGEGGGGGGAEEEVPAVEVRGCGFEAGLWGGIGGCHAHAELGHEGWIVAAEFGGVEAFYVFEGEQQLFLQC